MGVERYGSKTDVIVKLVLVFFIALLSFSIGTFVGKKFSDNQYKMAQLEPDAKHEGEKESHGDSRKVASVEEGHGEAKTNESLSDEEIAKLAEEFISDEETAPDPHGKSDPHLAATTKNDHAPASVDAGHDDHSSAPAKHDEHAASPVKVEAKAPAHHPEMAPTANTKKPELTKAEPLKAATRVAEGKTAGENKEIAKPTSRIPTALPKELADSAVGKFTLQIGAYQTEKEALKISADLKEKGFSAFYVSANVKGTKWYRVSMGLFTTKEEANKYRDALLKNPKIPATTAKNSMVQKIISAD